ncbi:MAG: TetR/AcrR family transcriptional regulator [Solirubrobacterales bacterium]
MATGAEATAPSAPERILDAACDLIAAEGIDEVRIARVAQRAGASTALVHHYFSTREELLEQALIHSFEQAGDERFQRRADAEETATQALARGLAESLPFPGPQEREWVLWVELWLRAVREPALRDVAARLYGRYRDWLAGLIRAGIETGEFSADADPNSLADLAMALLDGTGIRALIEDPEMDVERARALVAERLAAELRLDPGSLL